MCVRGEEILFSEIIEGEVKFVVEFEFVLGEGLLMEEEEEGETEGSSK